MFHTKSLVVISAIFLFLILACKSTSKTSNTASEEVLKKNKDEIAVNIAGEDVSPPVRSTPESRTVDGNINATEKSELVFPITSNTSNINTANTANIAPFTSGDSTDRTTWTEEKANLFTRLPKARRLTKEPYINGLVVAYHKNEFEKEYFSDDDFIPADKMAYDENQVGTVIIIKDKSEWIGDYRISGRKDTVPGFIVCQEVIIVDRSIPAVIYQKTFCGNPPAKKEMVDREAMVIDGETPNSKIQEFLNELPSK